MNAGIMHTLAAIRHELDLLDPEAAAVDKPLELSAALEDILARLRGYSQKHAAVAQGTGTADDRLLAVTDSLMAMAALDFSRTVPVDGSGDIVDAVATGVNMLAEELEHSVVSRSYIDAILQSLADMVIVKSPDGRILTVNRSLMQALGYGVNELIGKRIDDFLDGDSVKKIRSAASYASGDGTVVEGEGFLRRKTGEELPVAFARTVMRGGGGGIVFSARDITEFRKTRTALENSEERFRALFDNMRSGVAVYRVEGEGARFVFADFNRAGERIDGISREDVIGRDVVRVFPGIRDMGLLDVFRRVWLTGKPEHVPAVTYAEGGAVGWRENYIYRLPTGEIVAVYDDVTEQKKAQEAIARTAREWETTFNSASDMISIQNNDNMLIRVNRAYADAFGTVPEKLVGRKCYEVVHRTHEPVKDCPCARTIQSGAASHQEIFDPHLKCFLDISVSPMLDEGGRLTGMVHIAKDVTQRKQAEEAVRKSEEQLRDLFENASDLIQSIRPDGTFLYVNSAWLKALGYTNDELAGKTVFDILDGSCREKCSEAFASVMRGEKVDAVEACFCTRSGRKLVVEGNISCRTDERGVPLSTRAIFRDVTDRKEAEKKLALIMDELKRSNQELTDFAHIASHDLKEPLRKVLTFGERIKANAKGLDERSADYLARIQNAAGRMAALLDGLLVYARVTTQAKPSETVDLNAVAAEVLQDLEVRVAESGASVTVDTLPPVQADPLQMRQLLQNLLGNALKYHKPGVAPEITVTGVLAGTMAEIRVADNGIGIAPEDREKAFGVFQRLVGKGEYEGTGVGLAICKKIAERHGGSISIEAGTDAGSVFVITLPAAAGNNR